MIIFYHLRRTGGTTIRRILRERYDPKDYTAGHRYYYANKPSGFTFTFLRNPIYRCVSHLIHFDDFKKIKDIFCRRNDIFNNYYVRKFSLISKDQSKSTKITTQVMFDVALENMLKMDFVGFTEFFDDSVYTLGQLLGWNNYTYVAYNITNCFIDEHDFDLDFIAHHNQDDIKLYEFLLKNNKLLKSNNQLKIKDSYITFKDLSKQDLL